MPELCAKRSKDRLQRIGCLATHAEQATAIWSRAAAPYKAGQGRRLLFRGRLALLGAAFVAASRLELFFPPLLLHLLLEHLHEAAVVGKRVRCGCLAASR